MRGRYSEPHKSPAPHMHSLPHCWDPPPDGTSVTAATPAPAGVWSSPKPQSSHQGSCLVLYVLWVWTQRRDTCHHHCSALCSACSPPPPRSHGPRGFAFPRTSRSRSCAACSLLRPAPALPVAREVAAFLTSDIFFSRVLLLSSVMKGHTFWVQFFLLDIMRFVHCV